MSFLIFKKNFILEYITSLCRRVNSHVYLFRKPCFIPLTRGYCISINILFLVFFSLFCQHASFKTLAVCWLNFYSLCWLSVVLHSFWSGVCNDFYAIFLLAQKLIMIQIYFFWGCVMWDLGSLTRDWTWAPSSVWSRNYWTAREVPWDF